jgi:hypothetical protein
MTQLTRTPELTDAQLSYLRDLQVGGELPEGLKLSARVLEGSPDAIEALRETLTDLLAKRGFAADYSTTAEGELIEDLIDVLHLKGEIKR